MFVIRVSSSWRHLLAPVLVGLLVIAAMMCKPSGGETESES